MIKNNIKKSCVCGNPTIIRYDNIFSLTFGGRIQVPKILKWLYKDSIPEIRLERKYKIAAEKILIGELI